jgi:glutathione S-transferase
LHRLAVARVGGAGSVPCLLLPNGGDVIGDSARILRWVDATSVSARAPSKPPLPLLFPAALNTDVTSFCTRMDTLLGPAARVWAYAHLLPTQAFGAAITAHVPPLERHLCFAGGLLLVRHVIRRTYEISPSRAEEALSSIRAAFEDVGQQLADGRQFLFGGAFSGADLTFVSLAAPALGLPYGPPPRAGDAPPPAMAAEVAALRATPAGAYALRIWDQERKRVLAGGASEPASPVPPASPASPTRQ